MRQWQLRCHRQAAAARLRLNDEPLRGIVANELDNRWDNRHLNRKAIRRDVRNDIECRSERQVLSYRLHGGTNDTIAASHTTAARSSLIYRRPSYDRL